MTYFPNANRRVRLGRPTSYPWTDWTDGKERVLREGEDFKCMAESFVILARRTAKVRNLHVTVSTMTVSATAAPLEVSVNDAPVWLQPGGTYVLLKFTSEEPVEKAS
jgi:hypothetical protein